MENRKMTNSGDDHPREKNGFVVRRGREKGREEFGKIRPSGKKTGRFKSFVSERVIKRHRGKQYDGDPKKVR